jgi:class 3 adenylate cyclase/tetratricopeptide (TPR) repeat protein
MPLLTIVFTDVVESSATKRDVSLGRDNRERDHAYLEKVQTHHFDLVRASCKAFGGNEVSTMGDAFLLTFEDPVQAVRCAVDIQQKLNAEPIETPRGDLRLRIGIHSGYPEFFEGSWHGTDVDTAARVESEATEHQILLSSRTYELVRHMTDVQFHSRGEFALKGVDRIALWEADWDGRGPRPTKDVSLGEIERRHRVRRMAVAVAAGILLVTGAGYVISRLENDRGPRSFKPRQSVAVLGFKNLGSKEEDWLSSWVPERLNTELGTGEGLRMVSREKVDGTATDLALSKMSSYEKGTLAKLRSILKSDYVIAGSYVAGGNQNSDPIRLDVRLQDANSGDTVSSFAEAGSVGGLPEMLKRIATAVRTKMGLAGPVTPRAPVPTAPEAERLYTEGLVKLRAFDALGARDPLERAIAVEPKWAAPREALANAWQLLGYDLNAREEAKKAVELSADLPPEDQRKIEGRYRELTAEWDKAIEIYHSLWGVYRDVPDYALELAKVQTAAGKGREALATLADLQHHPQMGDDPQIDLSRAFAAESLSDVKLQKSAAAAAAEKASRLGSRYLAAQAYWQECIALNALGELQKATEACQQSAAAAPFALEIEARTKTVQASILLTQGHPAEALEMRMQALETARKIGSQKDVIGALMNLANLRATEGQTGEAQRYEREAIAIAREIGDKRQLVGLENNLGSDLNTEGDYQQAKGLFEDSLKTAREIGDQGGISTALQNLGALSLQMGDLALAEQEVRQALSTSQDAHLPSITAFAFNYLGDIQMAKGDFAEARKSYEIALNLFKEGSNQPSIAGTRLSLAKLALEEGKVTEAEALAHQAIQEFQAEKLVDNEADAHSTLAHCLILEGKVADAQQELESAGKLGVQDRTVRISIAITAARVKARSGKLKEARKDLEAQLKETRERNLVGLQLETRLALAEFVEPPEAKLKAEILTAVARDARNSGYLLFATKAEHLQMSPSH